VHTVRFNNFNLQKIKLAIFDGNWEGAMTNRQSPTLLFMVAILSTGVLLLFPSLVSADGFEGESTQD